MSKEHFIEIIETFIGITGNIKILELGSGQSRAILRLLNKFPELTYVGVEPNAKDVKFARELLKDFPNAKIFNRLAYEKIEGYENFDLCFSLSVLEHVKRLPEFLVASVAAVKSGGHVIHRYDLGHALYPPSFKEKIQVFIGNNFPKYLPENKFVRYVDEKTVCSMLENAGAKIQNITYHQMPSHKAFLKHFNADTAEKKTLQQEIFFWEDKVSPFLSEMNQKEREYLFPTIAIWAKKEGN